MTASDHIPAEIARADAVVVGGGPSGLTAAIAMAAAGFDVALVARQAPADNRTTALLASSVAALETLGVWESCREHAAPLASLRIVDATRRLWRAPEALFTASEIGLDAFAWNIENRHLIAAIEARAADMPNLRHLREDAASVDSHADNVTVGMSSGGRIIAKLAVGADGRTSLCRAAAGIDLQGKTYPQIALTFNISHSRPHRDISTEFHTEHGPFTTVPLPGDRSSIVCVVSPTEAEHIQNMSAEELDRDPRTAVAFDPRQDQNRFSTWRVSAGPGDRTPLRGRSHRACRRSGAPLSRRSVRKDSISGCAMPQPSRKSPPIIAMIRARAR